MASISHHLSLVSDLGSGATFVAMSISEEKDETSERRDRLDALIKGCSGLLGLSACAYPLDPTYPPFPYPTTLRHFVARYIASFDSLQRCIEPGNIGRLTLCHKKHRYKMDDQICFAVSNAAFLYHVVLHCPNALSSAESS